MFLLEENLVGHGTEVLDDTRRPRRPPDQRGGRRGSPVGGAVTVSEGEEVAVQVGVPAASATADPRREAVKECLE